MGDARPNGMRYSHAYTGRSRDLSLRVRRRLGATMLKLGIHLQIGMVAFVQEETGERVPVINNGFHWPSYFEHCPLDALLDTPCLIVRKLRAEALHELAQKWCDEVDRILKEEGSGYIADQDGAIHPLVDPAFQLLRTAIVEGAQAAEYSACAALMQKAFGYLDGAEPDTRAAIVAAFGAVESAFKTITGAAQLTASNCIPPLKQIVAQRYGTHDKPAARASHKIIASFSDWIDACHFYRHAPGKSDPLNAPFEQCHLLVSQAASFLRWLIALHSTGGEGK